MGGGMLNRQRDEYNDVGWGILPGNYDRFLTQLAPNDIIFHMIEVDRKN